MKMQHYITTLINTILPILIFFLSYKYINFEIIMYCYHLHLVTYNHERAGLIAEELPSHGI